MRKSAPAPDHCHRVHVQEQSSRAAVLGRLGVEYMGAAEAERKTLAAGRVLVQQIAQVGRGPVSCRDCQQHDGASGKHSVKAPFWQGYALPARGATVSLIGCR